MPERRRISRREIRPANQFWIFDFGFWITRKGSGVFFAGGACGKGKSFCERDSRPRSPSGVVLVVSSWSHRFRIPRRTEEDTGLGKPVPPGGSKCSRHAPS